VIYESTKEFPLKRQENKEAARFLLSDSRLPSYRTSHHLGHRSASEWVTDQYQMSTDKRSGITNDPNRPDDPEYIVRLLGQVVTVSLETVRVVKGLPALEK
jgi:predicted helicase